MLQLQVKSTIGGIGVFGDRLRDLREKKQIYQKDLAKILGVSAGAIGMYETNKRTPDFETLKKIADYFDVSIDYLLGKSDSINEVVLTKEMQEIFEKKSKLYDMIVNDLKASGQISDDMSFEEQYKVIKQRIELINDIFGKMKKLENNKE